MRVFHDGVAELELEVVDQLVVVAGIAVLGEFVQLEAFVVGDRLLELCLEGFLGFFKLLLFFFSYLIDISLGLWLFDLGGFLGWWDLIVTTGAVVGDKIVVFINLHL